MSKVIFTRNWKDGESRKEARRKARRYHVETLRYGGVWSLEYATNSLILAQIFSWYETKSFLVTTRIVDTKAEDEQ